MASPEIERDEAEILTLLASPRRREIMRLLWRTELAAGDIHAEMPDVSFPAVSIHLGKLQQAGLVEVRPVGRQRLYRARRQACGSVARMLERMWDDALWRLKVEAELEASRRGPRPAKQRRKKR
jgi:DNA-binding transcriptional ArsR family regulator